MRRWRPGHPLMLLWILLIFLPALFIQQQMEERGRAADASRREELREALLNDMLAFRHQFESTRTLDRMTDHAIRRLERRMARPGDPGRRPHAAESSPRPGMAPLIHDRFLAILRELGLPRPLFLIAIWPDEPVELSVAERIPLPIEPAEFRRRLRQDLFPTAGDLLLKSMFARERSQVTRSWPLFGRFARRDKLSDTFYGIANEYRNFERILWRRAEARFGPPGSPTALLVIAFTEADLDANRLVRFLCQQSGDGVSRSLVWTSGSARSRWHEDDRRIEFVSAPPISFLQDALIRQQPGTVGQHRIPMLKVTAPMARSEEVATVAAVRLGLLAWSLVTLLAVIRLQTGGLGSGIGIRWILGCGFALAMLPALAGLAAVATGRWHRQITDHPARTFARLDRRIEAATWRYWSAARRLERRIRRAAPDLARLAALPPRERLIDLQRLVDSTQGLVGNVHLADRTGITVAARSRHQNENPETDRAIADIYIELFRGIDQSPEALAEHPRRRTMETVSVGMVLAEKFLDLTRLGRIFARPGLISRHPFGNLLDFHFVMPLRQSQNVALRATRQRPRTDRSRRAARPAAEPLIGLFDCSGEMCNLNPALPMPRPPAPAWQSHPDDRGDRAHFFAYDSPFEPTFSNHPCTDGTDAEWWQRRPFAEQILHDMTPRRLTNRVAAPGDSRGDEPGQRPMIPTVTRIAGPRVIRLRLRPLPMEQVIALAESASQAETPTVIMRRLLLLCASLLVLAGATLLVAVHSLSEPLPVLIGAVSRAAGGDFDWRVALPPVDEFGQLATCFNLMAERLVERQKLGRFVSDEVLTAVAGGNEAAIGPTAGNLVTTVLVSDIRSFTTLSEQHPPEAIVGMLNDYFTAMESCLIAHGGSIVTFIGDCIVAHFPHRNDLAAGPARAMAAAVAMRRALADFNAGRVAAGQFTIRTGIGIATGPVISGLAGAATGRLGHVILGPALDRATELEGASRHAVATGIFLDRETLTAIGGRRALAPTTAHAGYEIVDLEASDPAPS